MKIAVMTSGGDASGMNGAVRAVARTAFAEGWEVLGVRDGYEGLLRRRIFEINDRDVGGILHRGGTVLGTARSAEFRTPEGQQTAARNLEEAGAEGLVVIGGEGSLTGALTLAERGLKVAGIPATIDNDVWGTDSAIGVDTALNTALEAIDRLKDTASSHNRAHVVEVMGRHCGYLALMSAIAGGAEAVLVPEFEPNHQLILRALKTSYSKGKPHFIVVVAEGALFTAEGLHEYINRSPGAFKSRLTVLGHVQRGGVPLAFDRIFSSRLGAAAVRALAEGETPIMVGSRGRTIERIPLEEVAGKSRPLDPEIYGLAETLAGLPEGMRV
ncbi:MAG: ATP-dependent 6-phosphofructokinase [Rubrobacteraceae bacterium]